MKENCRPVRSLFAAIAANAAVFAPFAASAANVAPDFEWAPSATDTAATPGGATDASADGRWTSSISMGRSLLMRSPSGTGYVFDLSNIPYAGITAAANPFSLSLYGDASWTSASARPVFAMFGSNAPGNTNDKIVLYRDGESLRLCAFDSAWTALASAEVAMPEDHAVHLYTISVDTATGAIALYVDAGGDLSSTASAGRALALDGGFQLGSVYDGFSANGQPDAVGLSEASGFALVKAMGFSSALSAADAGSLAADYPSFLSAAGDFTSDFNPNLSGYTVTLYDGAASTEQMYLGVTRGTVAIASGHTVVVPSVRILNENNSNCSINFNVDGTLVVTSTSSGGASNVYADRTSYRGVLFGHWYGTGTYNIRGSLLATNAYLGAVYTAGTQTINVNGGFLKVRGIYAYNNNATIDLYGNGVLEVTEIPSGGSAVTKRFRYGTFRVAADATETRAINFAAVSGNYTTLDPLSHTLTLAAGTVTGSGGIRVAPSEGGTVVFKSLTSGYTGNMRIESGNARVEDAAGYGGVITVAGGILDYYVSEAQYNLGHTFTELPVRGGTLVLRDSYGNLLQSTTTTVDGATIHTIGPGGKIWNNATGDGKLSTRDNWNLGFPEDGEEFTILVPGDTTLDCDRPIAAGTVIVKGSGTLTVDGTDDESMFTVTELVVHTPVVAAGTSFQPETVSFQDSGSLAIGPDGLLSNMLIEYSGSLPAPGDAFTPSNYASNVTSSGRWRGTIYLKNMAVTDFESNPYGNESSLLRLSGITGWLRAPSNAEYANIVPVELTDSAGTAFTVNNGNSANSDYNYRCASFTKLSGGGTFACSGSAPTVVVVFKDVSSFSGTFLMTNKMVVIGDAMPTFDLVASGRIYVAEGKSVSVRGGNTTDRKWTAASGIQIAGDVTASGLEYFGDSTALNLLPTGRLTLETTTNNQGSNESFSRVTGSGTLRLLSESTWRMLSNNNYPTTVMLENSLGDGLLLPLRTNYAIGGLKGGGDIRSDWETWNTVGCSLTINQCADGTWSGVFRNADLISSVTVNPGIQSTGTLTIAGDQKAYNDSNSNMVNSNSLAVAAGGAVSVTGSWVGDATVAGSLGGAGKIYGNLSMTSGSTLSTTGDTASLLEVSGSISIAGALTIQLPGGYNLLDGNNKLLVDAICGVTATGVTYTLKIGDTVVDPLLYEVVPQSSGLRLRSRNVARQPFRVILR